MIYGITLVIGLVVYGVMRIALEMVNDKE